MVAYTPARPLTSTRAPEPQAGVGELLVLDVERDVAEAVEGDRVGAELAVLEARQRHVEAYDLVGVDRVARVGQRRAGGQRGGDRGEDVAAVEGRATRLEAVARARDVDDLDDAAEALRGEREQAVVGADEDPVLLGGPQRDRAALARRPRGRRPPGGRPAAQNGSARRRTSAPVRTSWRGMPWVRSMTRASGAIRAITAWQTPTKSSSRP